MERDTGPLNIRDYLDFDVEIRGDEQREYSIAVRSPAGEAQEQMVFPFDDQALRDRLRDLEIALLRSGGTRRSLSREELTVQDFGRSLFEALLVGDGRTRYLMSLDKAEQQDKGLRMKLRVQPPELAVLPWEFLYDPDRDYLCFSPDTPIVRYVDLRQPVRQLTVTPPLRILGMVASPRGLDPLDIEHEKGLMNEAIEELRDGGLVELTWLEGQTWRDLRRAMRRGGPWHVFHFVGHGDFDVAREEGAIALTDGETGREHLLRSRDLARLLDGHRYLRLVFLNSCEGARGSEGDPFSGTAATLVRNRIPAVVAMQYEITDKAAIEFSRSFYEAVADGWPVDAAVAEARVAVSMDSMLEWGTPVLYMRSPDGRLFDISTETRRPEPPRHPEEDPLHDYREDVKSAWADGELHEHEVKRLKELAARLGLQLGVADDIEREIMGETIETILQRQEEAARQEERNRRLEELYTRAHRLHRDRKWQAVLDLFEQINSVDPVHPDPEGLLASSRDALRVQERKQRVVTLYDRGQRHMDAGEWQQALECFEEVRRLEPDYRETGALLAQARQQESAGNAETAETGEQSSGQMAGQSTDQAERAQPDYSTNTESRPLSSILGGNWWALALVGLIDAIHGLLDLSAWLSDPGVFFRLSASSLLMAIGVFFIIASRTAHPKLLLRTQGAISGLAGAVAFLGGVVGITYSPSTLMDALQETPFLIVHFSAFQLWGLCLGVIQVTVAIRGWDFMFMRLMMVSGVSLAIYSILGFYLTMQWVPSSSPGLLVLPIWLLASGISLMALAFRARNPQRSGAAG